MAGAIRLRSQSQGVWLKAEDPALGGRQPAAVLGPRGGGGAHPRRRLAGHRRRPPGRRAAQDHPLLGTRQRHPGRRNRSGGLTCPPSRTSLPRADVQRCAASRHRQRTPAPSCRVDRHGTSDHRGAAPVRGQPLRHPTAGPHPPSCAAPLPPPSPPATAAARRRTPPDTVRVTPPIALHQSLVEDRQQPLQLVPPPARQPRYLDDVAVVMDPLHQRMARLQLPPRAPLGHPRAHVDHRLVRQTIQGVTQKVAGSARSAKGSLRARRPKKSRENRWVRV